MFHKTYAELSYIAGETARDHRVKVTIGRPGEGSYANLEEKTITLDPEHTHNDGEARFVAAHEGAHIGETLSLEQRGIKTNEQKREYSAKIGLHSLFNVIEDGAINDRFCRKFPNLQTDTLESYPRKKHEDPLGFINLPDVQAIAALTGKPPLYAQALAGILGDWSELRHDLGFDKTLPEYQASPFRGGRIEDPRLQKFFDVVLQEARRAISFIPSPSDPTIKSFEMGQKRTAWCERVLYPALKELVDEDLRSLQQAIKENEPSENGNQPEGKQGKDQQGNEGQGQEGQGQQDKDQQSKGKGQQGQSGKQNPSRQQNKGGGAGGSPDKEQPNQEHGQSQGERQGISDSEAGRRAAELLAQAEDAIREALESLKERAEGGPPSATKITQEQNEKERENERQAQTAKEDASMAQQLRNALHKSLSPYHREYHEVAPFIEDAHARLMDVFDPERHFKWQKDRPTGGKLNMIGAMRFELTSEGHERMWEQRIDPQYPDQDIVIILDRSGSMESQDKYVYARRAVLFARELFQRLHIPTACVGFADNSERFLDFEDDIGESDTQERFMQNTAPFNQGTNDANAIEHAASLLKERSARKRTIIMISDAESGTPEKLKKTVHNLGEEGIPVLHFGIGMGTADQNGNYIHSKGDLTLAKSGPNAFLEVFCKEMEKLAEGILDHSTKRRDV